MGSRCRSDCNCSARRSASRLCSARRGCTRPRPTGTRAGRRWGDMATRSKKSVAALTVGDFFAVELTDGRFGACRVLDRPSPWESIPEARYVAACTYIGDAPPAIDHPELRALLFDERRIEKGQPPKLLGAWLRVAP